MMAKAWTSCAGPNEKEKVEKLKANLVNNISFYIRVISERATSFRRKELTTLKDC